MIQKRILVAQRVRRPPASGWSWVDRGFLREHAEHLSREAVSLYFFLSAAADRHGLSFYSDGATATLLRLPVQTVAQARDELLARDLVAYEPPLALCGHFCMQPIACERRDPESKGIVEGGVRYVKRNALAGRDDELQSFAD